MPARPPAFAAGFLTTLLLIAAFAHLLDAVAADGDFDGAGRTAPVTGCRVAVVAGFGALQVTIAADGDLDGAGGAAAIPRDGVAVVAGFGSLPVAVAADGDLDGAGSRSEEHTSELQSQQPISYAVFCLKKKFF